MHGLYDQVTHTSHLRLLFGLKVGTLDSQLRGPGFDSSFSHADLFSMLYLLGAFLFLDFFAAPYLHIYLSIAIDHNCE